MAKTNTADQKKSNSSVFHMDTGIGWELSDMMYVMNFDSQYHTYATSVHQ